MSKLVEYREQLAAAYKRIEDLNAASSRSADEEAELDRLITEANDIGPKFVREQNIDAAAQRSAEFNKPTERRGAVIAAPGAVDEQKIDRRSFAQRFIDSPAVKEYSGQGRSTPFDVGSFFGKHQVRHDENMGPDEVRTLIYGSALAADMVRPQLLAGINAAQDLQGGSVRDVLINGTTNSDAVTYFRELVFTNAAAGVAEASNTTDTSGTKAESALTFEQATDSVKTIAHWIPITRQTLDDVGMIEAYVTGRLLDGLRLTESNQLLNGAGGADLTGILQTGSVQALNAAYFAATPVVNAGDYQENFNRILRAKTKITTTGRARATFAVINPADMEVFQAIGNQMGNYYGPGPFGPGNGYMSLWGLRVVIDENIAAGTVLVGDGSQAIVWDRMQAQVFVGTIDKQFIRNMFTFLAEERLALSVIRPAAFAAVTLAAV